jgi:hypothetical protein
MQEVEVEEEPVLLHALSDVMTDVSVEAITFPPKPCPAVVTKKSKTPASSAKRDDATGRNDAAQTSGKDQLKDFIAAILCLVVCRRCSTKEGSARGKGQGAEQISLSVVYGCDDTLTLSPHSSTKTGVGSARKK